MHCLQTLAWGIWLMKGKKQLCYFDVTFYIFFNDSLMGKETLSYIKISLLC